jgi:ketosteroid isomerase-like protein
VSVEENMALARRFLEARANGDLDALEHMMAPTSSTTPWPPPKSPTARATSAELPSTLPPSPMFASSSRTR